MSLVATGIVRFVSRSGPKYFFGIFNIFNCSTVLHVQLCLLKVLTRGIIMTLSLLNVL